MWFFSPNIVTGILVILGFIFLFFITTRQKLRKQLPPEAKGRWPIIGHLHLLSGSQLIPIILADMADKYGPIFTLRLGFQPTLIVSNMEMAKECLETNDRVFVDRPKSIALEIAAYDQNMFAFSPYGPYWREVRKIAIVELLSVHRKPHMLKAVRESEINSALVAIYNRWVDQQKICDLDDHKVHVEMKEWFRNISLNIIFRAVVGKRISPDINGSNDQSKNNAASDVEDVKEFREFLTLFQTFHISNVIPIFKWLDIGGHRKKIKETANSIDFKLDRWLKEHKRRRRKNSKEGILKEQQQDFMDVLLDQLDESTSEHFKQQDKDAITKSTCLVLLLATSDKIATLVWTLSLLLNNRHTLKMAQDELDSQVGRERQVRESDIENLVYLQAIIKEAMRLYPAASFVSRVSVDDCNVGEYHVPARTRLLVNLYKLQRDPNVWSNPCDFQPERFLTKHKNVNFKGKWFELIPFGSGRRICPGIAFSTQVMHLSMARLLHSFEFDTPLGQSVDMTGAPGFSNSKATPLDVLVKPRLPGAVILQSE